VKNEGTSEGGQESLWVRCAPRIFPWRRGGGADPKAINNLCVILKIMFKNHVVSTT
jgi:hypothetical protein